VWPETEEVGGVSAQANGEGAVTLSSARLELKPYLLGGRLATTLLIHCMFLTRYLHSTNKQTNKQKESQWNFYCIHFQHPTPSHSTLQVTSTVNAAPPQKFARPPYSYYIRLAIKNRDGGVDTKSTKSISNFVEYRSSHSKPEMGNNRPDWSLAISQKCGYKSLQVSQVGFEPVVLVFAP